MPASAKPCAWPVSGEGAVVLPAVTEPDLDVVDAPIGIFDSGFGGLTVARSVVDLMPNEDIVYPVSYTHLTLPTIYSV